MKSLSIIPILFVLFISVSCESRITYSKTIVNDSSHDIWIIIPNSPTDCTNPLVDSTLIVKNTHHQYESLVYKGQSTSDFKDCSVIMCFDTLPTRIATNDSLKLSFPIERNANWEYTEDKGFAFNSNACNCTLMITDDDIN
jgi:hypothetical protein